MSKTKPIGRANLEEPNPPGSLLSGPLAVFRSARDYRYLVSNFIQRDIRLKYRNSAMGYFWSLLEPLLFSSVYFLLFSIIAGMPQREYPLWVLVGVITWGFFSRSVNSGVTSLTRNEGLIKQVYFPREIFVITTVGAQTIMAVLSLLIAVPFAIYLGIAPSQHVLMVPVGVFLVALLALGIGLGFSPLNVVNRDVEHFFRFLMRAGLYLSPVMWTVEMIPETRSSALDYLMLNPMVVPLTMIRNGISGVELGIDALDVAYSVAFCTLSFLLGAIVFKRSEALVVKKL